jgi:hypothetical protein
MGAGGCAVEVVAPVLSQSGITWGGSKLAPFFLSEMEWRLGAALRDATCHRAAENRSSLFEGLARKVIRGSAARGRNDSEQVSSGDAVRRS